MLAIWYESEPFEGSSGAPRRVTHEREAWLAVRRVLPLVSAAAALFLWVLAPSQSLVGCGVLLVTCVLSYVTVDLTQGAWLRAEIAPSDAEQLKQLFKAARQYGIELPALSGTVDNMTNEAMIEWAKDASARLEQGGAAGRVARQQ